MELASPPSHKNVGRPAPIGLGASFFMYEWDSMHTSLGSYGLKVDGTVICHGINPGGNQLPKFYNSGIVPEMRDLERVLRRPIETAITYGCWRYHNSAKPSVGQYGGKFQFFRRKK
jgi:hypothetical protein